MAAEQARLPKFWSTLARFVVPSMLVGAIWLVVSSGGINPTAAQRIADLTDLRNALAAYHKEHNAYPTTPSGGWLGLYNAWGPSSPNWVPDLAPRYISALPRDPRRNPDPTAQYLYRSDGKDYKLLTFYPGVDCEGVANVRPDLLDALRGGKGPYRCHAYGYWSPGAASW